ncbi:MAG: Hsp70 family protein [Aestuariivita sp.]|nr:Hsp70 family protein [Aestuariivita sp.]
MNEQKAIIGIDLGTTNSEVVVIKNGKPVVVRENNEAIVPSCVGIDEASKVIVGQQARNQWAAAPEKTIMSIKRLMGTDEKVSMGDKQFTPQEISAYILKTLKERAERDLGHEVSKAVITVPAYFTDIQRQATREAGKIAGLEVVRIINEPTAAALSYESLTDEARKILVYDLGGGTFDVSVVLIENGIVEVLASTGNNKLGGHDFDEVLLERLNDTVENELRISQPQSNLQLQARLRRAAEQAKIGLSNQPYFVVEEDHVGMSAEQTRHLSHEINRFDFEKDIDALLAKTIDSVTSALTDANVKPNELDRILLVGGSTRIPKVRQLLKEHLGQEPHEEVDPDLCVAIGAGIQAGIEMGLDMQAVLVDVTPYTFGISILGELFGQQYEHVFSPIIHRNTKLPITKSEPYFKIYREQKAIDFIIYQGENPDALRNEKIGKFIFEGLDPSEEANEQGLTCTFHLDLDGILHVELTERFSKKIIKGRIENALGKASGDDLGKSETAYEEIISTDEADDAVDEEPNKLESIRQVLREAEEILKTAPEDELEEISKLMKDLKEAIKHNNLKDAERLQGNLEEIMFYLR